MRKLWLEKMAVFTWLGPDYLGGSTRMAWGPKCQCGLTFRPILWPFPHQPYWPIVAHMSNYGSIWATKTFLFLDQSLANFFHPTWLLSKKYQKCGLEPDFKLESDFKFSRLKFFWGTPVPLGVCDSKPSSISSASKNLRSQRPLRAEITIGSFGGAD